MKKIVTALILGLIAIQVHATTTTLTIWGYSMTPTLLNGDLLLANNNNLDDLEVGDIVVYHHPYYQETFCHRIIEIDDDEFRTQGDNNRFPDIGVWDRSIIQWQVTAKFDWNLLTWNFDLEPPE